MAVGFVYNRSKHIIGQHRRQRQERGSLITDMWNQNSGKTDVRMTYTRVLRIFISTKSECALHHQRGTWHSEDWPSFRALFTSAGKQRCQLIQLPLVGVSQCLWLHSICVTRQQQKMGHRSTWKSPVIDLVAIFELLRMKPDGKTECDGRFCTARDSCCFAISREICAEASFVRWKPWACCGMATKLSKICDRVVSTS